MVSLPTIETAQLEKGGGRRKMKEMIRRVEWNIGNMEKKDGKKGKVQVLLSERIFLNFFFLFKNI